MSIVSSINVLDVDEEEFAERGEACAEVAPRCRGVNIPWPNSSRDVPRKTERRTSRVLVTRPVRSVQALAY